MQVAPGGPPQTQTAPPERAQGAGQGSGPAEEAIESIQAGFMQLGKLIQAAGQNLPPEDVKLFEIALKATDDMVQSLTGPGGEGGPEPRTQQSGPMPVNANAGAKQAM